jgi:hypothetical protein
MSATTNNHFIVSKIYALFSPFVFGFMPAPAFDIFLAPLVLSFLGIAIVTRSLKLAPEMRLPIAAMVVASLLMPRVIGGSWFADIRLPVMLPFVIIASTRFEPSRQRVLLPIAAVALGILGVRVWTVSQAWRDYDRWFAEFRTASAVIAQGARLLVVQPRHRRTNYSCLNTGNSGEVAAAFFCSYALPRGDRPRGIRAMPVRWAEDFGGGTEKSANNAVRRLGPDNARTVDGKRSRADGSSP